VHQALEAYTQMHRMPGLYHMMDGSAASPGQHSPSNDGPTCCMLLLLLLLLCQSVSSSVLLLLQAQNSKSCSISKSGAEPARGEHCCCKQYVCSGSCGVCACWVVLVQRSFNP
jgi:hypothetical protein